MGHPINSAIGYPEEGFKVNGHSIEIKGWAHGDGTEGTQATKVEISTDGGNSWHNAHELVMEDKPPGKKVFSWTLWKYKLDTSSIRGDL
jgi:hypothetical protein